MRNNMTAALSTLPLILCLFLTILADHALGQLRVYGKVDPNAGNPEVKLAFDVNSEISDNVAPNVFFTSDGTRGYVAYAGSGTVLGFSAATGEITARIATGGRPSTATPLADGHTLAFVSTRDNRIFLVDTDTDAVAATYIFDQAEFGFGSVLALSPDGSTGYVSSTGTSQVIKFSMSDGQELGRLGGFGGPCQITVSLDGSTLMVVDTIRETLVFVDAASLKVKATMKNPDAKAVNFTVASRAVLAKDGNTGIIASRDVNGVYGSDTVILFKTATGEMLNSTSVGAEPLFTTLTPDGKYWVVLCTDSLWKISTSDFTKATELMTQATQSEVGANVLFSADSRYAYYTSSSDDRVYQHDLEHNTVVGRVTVGGSANKGKDLVSSLGMAPDGKAFAVVSFAANVLNLVEQTSSLSSATFVSSPTRFTGVSLVNLASESNKVTFTALDIYGQTISGTDVTNPVDYYLSPNQQVSLTLGEIFKFDSSKEQVGWLSTLTSSPQAVGYLTMGDANLTRLDAAPLFSRPLTEFIVPDIAKGSGISVELDIVNPNYMQTTYDITRYDASGSTAEPAKTGNIAYPTNRTNQTVLTLFPNMADGATGYLRLKTDGNLLNTTFTQTDNALSALNGIQISDFDGIKALYSPQFVVGYGYKTILNVINAGSSSADVTITLHNAAGLVVGQPHHATLAANAQLKNDLAAIFQGDPAVSDVTGWVEIQSSQDHVVGSITFTNPDGRFISTLALLGVPSTDFIFPVLAQTDEYETGIAILNANPEPATVTLEVWGVDGTMSASTAVTLGANSRQADYLRSYFPNLGQVLKGNIRVHSTRSLFGMALIHDQGFNFMTAVPSFPLP